MYKKIFFLLLFFCLNAFAQQSQEEISLSNEYLSILNSNNYNQSRIDRIESIAESKEEYEYLRIYIAGTYFFYHPSRKVHTKKDIYKRFLKPNLDSRQFNSIPLSTFVVAIYENNYEKEFINELQKRIIKGDGWSKINLAGYYYFKSQPAKALDILGDLYKKRIGIFFNSDALIVGSLMPNTSVPFVKKGDLILAINGISLYDINSITNELKKYEPGSTQTLAYERDGKKLESSFVIQEDFDYMTSPYAALLHLNMENTYEASKLINNFKNYKVDDAIQKSPLYGKLEGINDNAFCRLNLNPAVINIEKRLAGIDSCKSSIAKLEQGLLIEGTGQGHFEYQLYQYNPFWGITYQDSIGLLSSSYMKGYLGLGLGLEQERPNLELAKTYLEKSPFLYLNSEAIKFAGIDIFQDGGKIPSEQYKKISNNTIQTLQNLSNASGHPGYSARFHLLRIYKYDGKYKNLNKAYEIASKSYELDKENYPSVIISLSQLYYYGNGVRKNRQKSHEILEEFAAVYQNNPTKITSSMQWAFDVLSRNFHDGKVVKKDLIKSYEYGKIIEGRVESIDILNASKVIDGDVNVSKEILDKTLLFKPFLEMISKENLNSYVAYKAFAGVKPFTKTDITTACNFSSNDPKILSNYISQYIYSYCVITEEIEGKRYDYEKFLKDISRKGSSEASWLLFNLGLDKSNKDSNQLKDYLVKSKQQLKGKSSKRLIEDIYWLSDTTIFDVRKKDLDADFVFINNRIKKENDFKRAIANAEKEKERKQLAELRKANRKEAAEKTGKFLGNLLEFTFKAALVVGAAAVVGDALEDASPEAIQAFSDSLSNSYQTYTYDWDGFYDAYGNWVYRCRTIENGRFAEDYHCIGEFKDDDRWPSY